MRQKRKCLIYYKIIYWYYNIYTNDTPTKEEKNTVKLFHHTGRLFLFGGGAWVYLDTPTPRKEKISRGGYILFTAYGNKKPAMQQALKIPWEILTDSHREQREKKEPLQALSSQPIKRKTADFL